MYIVLCRLLIILDWTAQSRQIQASATANDTTLLENVTGAPFMTTSTEKNL